MSTDNKSPEQTGRKNLVDRRTFIGQIALTAGGLSAAQVFKPFNVKAESTAGSAGKSVVVETAYGRLRGTIVKNEIIAFKGIPYGGPVEGQGRFMPPTKPAPWSGIRDALNYGAKAVQLQNEHSAENGYFEPWVGWRMPLDEVPISENCLFLNVWTPSTRTGKRAVMLWIHGGGYMTGSGSWAWYDGTDLAGNSDVVVVTVNHRLNTFGYLELGDLGGEKYAASGNVGQLDLVAALTWVRDNIAEFGGDPGNVTIFGQSGGGSKVSTLLAMPVAKGLFHKAIIESGAGVRQIPRNYATETAKAILDELSIKRVDDIHGVPADRLFKASRAVANRDSQTIRGRKLGGFGSVVDGNILPNNPFDPVGPSVSASVPIVVGCTKDEASFFQRNDPGLYAMDMDGLAKRTKIIVGNSAGRVIDIYRGTYPRYTPGDLFVAISTDFSTRKNSVILAERKIEQHSAPVYMYYWTYGGVELGGKPRAPHSMEILFVFDHPGMNPYAGTAPGRFALADKTSKAWSNFAKSGDPNHSGIPHWAPYSLDRRATMILDLECKVVDDPNSQERKVWGV